MHICLHLTDPCRPSQAGQVKASHQPATNGFRTRSISSKIKFPVKALQDQQTHQKRSMGRVPEVKLEWILEIREKGKKVRERERSERKSRAGGEKGPKLEQEAMLINNLADPRAPDTECIKYCWDTLLRHSHEERVKWCWKLQTLDRGQKGQAKVRAWTHGVEKFPFFCSFLSGQPTSHLHTSSQLGFKTHTGNHVLLECKK